MAGLSFNKPPRKREEKIQLESIESLPDTPASEAEVIQFEKPVKLGTIEKPSEGLVEAESAEPIAANPILQRVSSGKKATAKKPRTLKKEPKKKEAKTIKLESIGEERKIAHGMQLGAEPPVSLSDEAGYNPTLERISGVERGASKAELMAKMQSMVGEIGTYFVKPKRESYKLGITNLEGKYDASPVIGNEKAQLGESWTPKGSRINLGPETPIASADSGAKLEHKHARDGEARDLSSEAIAARREDRADAFAVKFNISAQRQRMLTAENSARDALIAYHKTPLFAREEIEDLKEVKEYNSATLAWSQVLTESTKKGTKKEQYEALVFRKRDTIIRATEMRTEARAEALNQKGKTLLGKAGTWTKNAGLGFIKGYGKAHDIFAEKLVAADERLNGKKYTEAQRAEVVRRVSRGAKIVSSAAIGTIAAISATPVAAGGALLTFGLFTGRAALGTAVGSAAGVVGKTGYKNFFGKKNTTEYRAQVRQDATSLESLKAQQAAYKKGNIRERLSREQTAGMLSALVAGGATSAATSPFLHDALHHIAGYESVQKAAGTVATAHEVIAAAPNTPELGQHVGAAASLDLHTPEQSIPPIYVTQGHGAEALFGDLHKYVNNGQPHQTGGILDTLAKAHTKDIHSLTRALGFPETNAEGYMQPGDSLTIEHGKLLFHHNGKSFTLMEETTDKNGHTSTHVSHDAIKMREQLYPKVGHVEHHPTHHTTHAKHHATTHTEETQTETRPQTDNSAATADNLNRTELQHVHDTSSDVGVNHESTPADQIPPTPDHAVAPTAPEHAAAPATSPDTATPPLDHTVEASSVVPVFEHASPSIEALTHSGPWSQFSHDPSMNVFTTETQPDTVANTFRLGLYDVMRESGTGPHDNESIAEYISRAGDALHEHAEKGLTPFMSRVGIYKSGEHLIAHGGDGYARDILAREYVIHHPTETVIIENADEHNGMMIMSAESIQSNIYQPYIGTIDPVPPDSISLF